jgi:phage terminase small subunit
MTPKPFPAERPLCARQQRFVDEYLKCLNGTKAAIAAGYSSKTARVTASQLLTKPNIQTALEAANAKRQQQTGVTPERVLRDIDCAATLDIALLFDEQGYLKPVRDLPLEVRQAVVSIEVVRRNLTAGDGTVEHVHKVKLVDKGKMLELLARHVGLFEPEPLPASQCPAFALPPGCTGVRVH